MRRMRGAPNANLVASSRARALPRASNNPAMFAQAASDRPITTANNTNSGLLLPSRRVQRPRLASVSPCPG